MTVKLEMIYFKPKLFSLCRTHRKLKHWSPLVDCFSFIHAIVFPQFFFMLLIAPVSTTYIYWTHSILVAAGLKTRIIWFSTFPTTFGNWLIYIYSRWQHKYFLCSVTETWWCKISAFLLYAVSEYKFVARSYYSCLLISFSKRTIWQTTTSLPVSISIKTKMVFTTLHYQKHLQLVIVFLSFFPAASRP